MARWRDIDGGISRLRDGTLLIHGNYPFVIRIKRDFTSPYLAEHDKLFWVDRAVIQKIREKAFRLPGLPLQNANDAVYRYLLNLRKEKTDGK